MASTLQRVVSFGCHCSVASHLSNHRYLKYLTPLAAEKISSVFAMRTVTRQEVRDQTAKVIKAIDIDKEKGNNAWAQIVIALDELNREKN